MRITGNIFTLTEGNLETAKPKISLEENTYIVLDYLQKNGRCTLQELHEKLPVPYKRISDIISILTTTPLVHKDVTTKEYFWCGNTGTSVNIKVIHDEIEKEKRRIAKLKSII